MPRQAGLTVCVRCAQIFPTARGATCPACGSALTAPLERRAAAALTRRHRRRAQPPGARDRPATTC
jgi:uncharacterized paraquat-inducible protein A